MHAMIHLHYKVQCLDVVLRMCLGLETKDKRHGLGLEEKDLKFSIP